MRTTPSTNIHDDLHSNDYLDDDEESDSESVELDLDKARRDDSSDLFGGWNLKASSNHRGGAATGSNQVQSDLSSNLDSSSNPYNYDQPLFQHPSPSHAAKVIRPSIHPNATSCNQHQPSQSSSRLSTASSHGSISQSSDLATPTASISSSSFFSGGSRERDNGFFFGNGSNPPLSTIPTSPYTSESTERKCWDFGMDMIVDADESGKSLLEGKAKGGRNGKDLDPTSGRLPMIQEQHSTWFNDSNPFNSNQFVSNEKSNQSPTSPTTVLPTSSSSSSNNPQDQISIQIPTISNSSKDTISSRLRPKNPKKLNLDLQTEKSSGSTRKKGKRKASELEEDDSPTSSSSPNTAGSSSKSTALKDGRYACSFSGCEKTFSTSGHAARHSKIHSGFKPYRCTLPGCGYRFDRRDNALVHYKLHFNDEKFSEEIQQGARKAWEDGLAIEVITKVSNSPEDSKVEREMVTEMISGINSVKMEEPYEIRVVIESGRVQKPKAKPIKRSLRSSSVGLKIESEISSDAHSSSSLSRSRSASISRPNLRNSEGPELQFLNLPYSFASKLPATEGSQSNDQSHPTFRDSYPFSTTTPSSSHQSISTSSHSTTTINPFKKSKVTPFSEPPTSEPSIFLDVNESSHHGHGNFEAISKQIDENQRKRSKTFSLSLPPLRDGNAIGNQRRSLDTYHYDFSREAANAIQKILNNNPSIKHRVPCGIVGGLSSGVSSLNSATSSSTSRREGESGLVEPQSNDLGQNQNSSYRYQTQDWKDLDMDFMNGFKDFNDNNSYSHFSKDASMVDSSTAPSTSTYTLGSQSSSKQTLELAKAPEVVTSTDDYDPTVDQARLQSFNDAFSSAFGPGLNLPI